MTVNLPITSIEQLKEFPELMTVKLVAEKNLVGFSTVSTVKKLVHDEELGAVNMAREGSKIDRFRIRKSDIVEFWKKRSNGSVRSEEKKEERQPAPKRPTRKIPRKRSS